MVLKNGKASARPSLGELLARATARRRRAPTPQEVGGRPGKGDSGVNPSRRSAGCQQHIPHKRDKHNANEMPSAAEKLNVVVVGGASSVFDALQNKKSAEAARRTSAVLMGKHTHTCT